MYQKLKLAQTVFLLVMVVLLVLACASHTQPKLQKNSNTASLTKRTNTNAELTLEHQFVKQLNMLRTQARKCGDQYFAAAAPLSMDDRLTEAAYRHSSDMADNDFLDHVSSNGGTLVDRLEKVNYRWRAIAENVAHNQRTVDQVLQDWLSSPGHCSNMMSSEYRHTGIAQVNWYWTQVYATSKLSR